MESLLGNADLVNNKGEKVTVASLLEKKAVGLYFSAHWCPPCRNFTPVLAKNYTDHYKALGMEIVFISSDNDQASFNEYFGSMPWLSSASYAAASALQQKLSPKFKIRGIPSLVLVNPKTGEVINSNARGAVQNDPNGEQFPWPSDFKSLLGPQLKRNDDTNVDAASLEGHIIGMYFSAHWCGPCKRFTPILIKRYEKLKAAGKKFEIVFVSLDKSTEEFNGYFATMPWLAVDRKRGAQLASAFDVEGIPHLVLLDGLSGKVITKEGVMSFTEDEDSKEFPYYPKLVNRLSPAHIESLQEKPGLIVFSGSVKEETTKIAAALEKAALKDKDDNKDGLELCYFYAEADPLAERIKLVAGATGTSVMVLDLTQGLAFYSKIASPADVTEASLTSFLADFRKGKVDPSPLSPE